MRGAASSTGETPSNITGTLSNTVGTASNIGETGSGTIGTNAGAGMTKCRVFEPPYVGSYGAGVLFGGRVLNCLLSINAAGLGLVVDDFAARAEGLHGVNQPGVHGVAVPRAAGLGEDV